MYSKSPRQTKFTRRHIGVALLGLSLLGAGLAAGAAPRQIEAFNDQTWAALQAGLKSPAVVVFSSTDCVHCPAVLKDMAAQRPKLKAQLLAVVMDQEPGLDDKALLAKPHYRVADRLFAFDGQAQALRYAVNPQWRGMTPYVALLRPGAPAQFVLGPPSSADLQSWAKQGKALSP